jgi:hypothetical protein
LVKIDATEVEMIFFIRKFEDQTIVTFKKGWRKQKSVGTTQIKVCIVKILAY